MADSCKRAPSRLPTRITLRHRLAADIVAEDAGLDTTPKAMDTPADPRAWGRVRRIVTAHSAFALTTLSVLTVIGLWAFASRMLDSPLFPVPSAILSSLVELIRSGALLADIGVSLRRIAIGFSLGCIVGIPLGLGMGLFPLVRAFCEPVVQFLRFVPPIAWLIPAIMWFGIGETSKILIIFYMTVFLSSREYDGGGRGHIPQPNQKRRKLRCEWLAVIRVDRLSRNSEL